MTARSQLVSRLATISRLRSSREQAAQARAADAKTAAQKADQRSDAAKADRLEGVRAWETAATRLDVFDPTLLGFWSHEIARLGEECETAEAIAGERAAAEVDERRRWRATVVEAESAARLLKRAQQRLLLQREEQRLSEQADLSATRRLHGPDSPDRRD
jgi:hypothetical protein